MPRKNLIKTNEYFYHITTRANDKEWFSIPLSEVWEISILSFQKAQMYNRAVVSQYVLMNNHYHLLIRTPNCDIDKFMFWFNKTFSEKLGKRSRFESRIFGNHYKWSLIKNDIYFQNVFRYIYQNPLRAGLAVRCEDYPYSTRFYTFRNLKIPFQFNKIGYLELKDKFINQKLESGEMKKIRSGLKKPIYQEKRDPTR